MFNKLEKGWIVQSLNTQRAALIRSRNKEMTGGEIHTLRTKEIEFLNSLISKMEGVQAHETAETPPNQQSKK